MAFAPKNLWQRRPERVLWWCQDRRAGVVHPARVECGLDGKGREVIRL